MATSSYISNKAYLQQAAFALQIIVPQQGPQGASIAAYVGPAQKAVRKALGLSATASAIATAISTLPAPQAKLSQDLVSLAARGDTDTFRYGSDARLANTARDLTANVSTATLNRIGLGASSSLTAPVSSGSHSKLENGTIRDTSITLLQRDVSNVRDGSVGVSRVLSDRIVVESGGNANSGAALATVRRDESTATITTADSSTGTIDRQSLSRTVTTSSENTNVRADETLQDVSYQVVHAAAGSGEHDYILQTIHNFTSSVTTKTDTTDSSGNVLTGTNGQPIGKVGAVISATQRDELHLIKYDLVTGAVSDSDRIQSVTLSTRQDAKGATIVTSQTTDDTVSTVLTAGQRADTGKTGAASLTVSEQALTTNGTINLSTGAISVSTTERNTLFAAAARLGATGKIVSDGLYLASADETSRTASASRAANGTVTASATDRASSLTLQNTGAADADTGKDVLALSAAKDTVRTVSASLALNGIVTVRGTDESLQVSSLGASPVLSLQPALSARIGADGKVLSGSLGGGDADNPLALVSFGHNSGAATGVLLQAPQASGSNARGPEVSVDLLNHTVSSDARTGGGSADADAVTGTIATQAKASPISARTIVNGTNLLALDREQQGSNAEISLNAAGSTFYKDSQTPSAGAYAPTGQVVTPLKPATTITFA